MLDAFAHKGFSGRAPDGLTYDWKDWRGGAHGYEGFLVDNYYALLAVLDRAGMIAKLPRQLRRDEASGSGFAARVLSQKFAP
jgi:hypothetical protein